MKDVGMLGETAQHTHQSPSMVQGYVKGCWTLRLKIGAELYLESLQHYISLRTVGFVPTRRVFGGRSHSCLICAAAECPVGGGMWGIFGKPLNRAIWDTLGLHACMRH